MADGVRGRDSGTCENGAEERGADEPTRERFGSGEGCAVDEKFGGVDEGMRPLVIGFVAVLDDFEHAATG